MSFYPTDVSRRYRILILFMLVLSLAACGGPGGRAAPTPLPPGERIAQPTPLFVAQATPTTAMPTPEPTLEEAEVEAAVESVQALLATQIALRAAEVETVEVTPTPPAPVAENGATRRSVAPSVLNRPTSLGIVGGAGAGFFAAPGGSSIRGLPAGTTVTITGRSGDGGWYAAYLEDGQAGWVASGAVRVFGDRDQLQVVTTSASPGIVATMIAEASKPLGPIATPAPAPANRRTAPTATPTAVTASPTGSENEADPSPAAQEPRPQAVVIVDGLNIREGPGTDFTVVGGLARDNRVTLLARNEAGDWLQIERAEGTGWIYAPLVETDTPIAELPLAVDG
jgi:uncharacterized protein YraI/predicted small lipoprotein YifL